MLETYIQILLYKFKGEKRTLISKSYCLYRTRKS